MSREDAIAIFKECLREMGVSTSWKWEDANRVVQNDPRVKALRTISERKQVFNDYINEMKTRERNDAKQRRLQVYWRLMVVATGRLSGVAEGAEAAA